VKPFFGLAVTVRHFLVATGHHNECDGSEQARKAADYDDNKHDSPHDAVFGLRRNNRELGGLPRQNRTGYKSCRSIGGHTPV
jgi:hypothetical protein